MNIIISFSNPPPPVFPVVWVPRLKGDVVAGRRGGGKRRGGGGKFKILLREVFNSPQNDPWESEGVEQRIMWANEYAVSRKKKIPDVKLVYVAVLLHENGFYFIDYIIISEFFFFLLARGMDCPGSSYPKRNHMADCHHWQSSCLMVVIFLPI